MTYRYRLFGTFRLLLAIMVVVQHSLPVFGHNSLRMWLAPLEIGSVAVLLFFVLSGFIISEAASQSYEGRPAAFAFNRMLRIYPPYLIALALTFAAIATVEYAGGHDVVALLFEAPAAVTAAGIASNVLAIFPLAHKVPGLSEVEPILLLAWALRIELFFYAVVAVALVAAAALKQPVARILGAIATGLLAFQVVRFQELRGIGLEFTPYFVLGAAAYFAIEPASVRRRAFSAILVLVSAAMIAFHINGQTLANETAGYVRDIDGQLILFFFSLSVWLALLAVPRTVGPLPDRLRWADQRLGDMTYPLYLTHMAVLLLCVWLLPRPSTLAIGLVLAAALAVAAVMHWAVETPLSYLRRRIREPGGAVRASASSRP